MNHPTETGIQRLIRLHTSWQELRQKLAGMEDEPDEDVVLASVSSTLRAQGQFEAQLRDLIEPLLIVSKIVAELDYDALIIATSELPSTATSRAQYIRRVLGDLHSAAAPLTKLLEDTSNGKPF